MTLEGKTALVTGAARGQGRAHAVALAKAGADLILLDPCENVASTVYENPKPQELEDTAEAVRALGRSVITLPIDARNLQAVKAGVESAEAELGPVDIAVINHGIWNSSLLHEMDEELWDEMIDVNLTSVWKVLRVVAPGMVERRTGSIVLTASVAGVVGGPGCGHYSAAKHGVVGIMKSAALELGPYAAAGKPGADRSVFEDAVRHSNLTGGLIAPSEVASVVAWLVSDEACQVNGHALPVDGGQLSLLGFNHGPFLMPTSRGARA